MLLVSVYTLRRFSDRHVFQCDQLAEGFLLLCQPAKIQLRGQSRLRTHAKRHTPLRAVTLFPVFSHFDACQFLCPCWRSNVLATRIGSFDLPEPVACSGL